MKKNKAEKTKTQVCREDDYWKLAKEFGEGLIIASRGIEPEADSTGIIEVLLEMGLKTKSVSPSC